MDVLEGLLYCCGQNPLSLGLHNLSHVPLCLIQLRALKPEYGAEDCGGRAEGRWGSMTNKGVTDVLLVQDHSVLGVSALI